MRFRSVFAPSWQFSPCSITPSYSSLFLARLFAYRFIVDSFLSFMSSSRFPCMLNIFPRYFHHLFRSPASCRRVTSYTRWDGTGRIYGVSKYIGQAVRQTSAMRDIALYSKLHNQRNLIVPKWKFSRVFIKMIKFMSITVIFYKI